MANKDFKVKNGLDIQSPLPVSMGGTGQTSTSNTLNSLLPSQAGNANKVLSSDGTNTTWVAQAVAYQRGGTASRPQSPTAGDLYYNTDYNYFESYTANGWFPIAAAPGIPTGVTATNQPTNRAFNNGQMSVAFTSASSGGAASSFVVTPSPTTSPSTFSGGTSPITVTGLSSSTQYTYTVSATSPYGTSSASSASSAVIATTVPQAPTINSVTSGDTQVSIGFTANATGGSSITGYSITSSPASTNTTQSASSSPYIFTGLTNGTAYTFTATATNANGTSTSSTASNSVTPSGIIQSFEKIGTYSASGSTVSITSIPDTYRHLVLAGHSADNRNVAYSGINIVFNGDSGANYWFSYLTGDNRSSTTSVGSYANAYTTNFGFNNMGGPTSSGSYTMFSLMNIFDYADTSKLTTINHKNGWGDAANTGYVIRSTHQREQGFWNNTNKVSSITITTPFGPFRNTEWTLYGVKD